MKTPHRECPRRDGGGKEKKRTSPDQARSDERDELPSQKGEQVGTVAPTVDNGVFPKTTPVASPYIREQPATTARDWRRGWRGAFGRLSLFGFLLLSLAFGIGLTLRRVRDLLGKRDPSCLAVCGKRPARPGGRAPFAMSATPRALVSVRRITADPAAATAASPFLRGGRGRATHQADARDGL
jgi:hypothetical protein